MIKQIKIINNNSRKKRFKLIFTLILFMLTGLIIAGCGSHDSGFGDHMDDGFDSNTPNFDTMNDSTNMSQGVFTDSPVQGLDYYSASSSGVTDKDGHFMYYEGEMMAFSMGNVILGEAMAREIMTPLGFIDESERPFDETHPVATNMGRFLQALDTDGDPENGITISDDVRNEVNGRMIDFHQSVMDFESDPDTEALFDTLNGLNMPLNGLMWGLVDIEEAQQHMSDHMGEYMGRYMDGGAIGSGTDNNMGSH